MGTKYGWEGEPGIAEGEPGIAEGEPGIAEGEPGIAEGDILTIQLLNTKYKFVIMHQYRKDTIAYSDND